MTGSPGQECRFERALATYSLFPLPFPPLLPSHPPNIVYVDAWLHHGFFGTFGRGPAFVRNMRGAADGPPVPRGLWGWVCGFSLSPTMGGPVLGLPLGIRVRSCLGGELLQDQALLPELRRSGCGLLASGWAGRPASFPRIFFPVCVLVEGEDELPLLRTG